jgi:hypothetical protein
MGAMTDVWSKIAPPTPETSDGDRPTRCPRRTMKAIDVDLEMMGYISALAGCIPGDMWAARAERRSQP